MEQGTGPKLGMVYDKGVYCYSAYLTYMQSTSCKSARLDESQAGIKIAGKNIKATDKQMTSPLWERK